MAEWNIDMVNQTQFKLDKVKPIAGFAAEYIGPHQTGRILARAFVNFDNPEFYRFIDQISNMYLGSRVLVDSVYSFLVVIHKDLAADAYINNLPIEISILNASQKSMPSGKSGLG